MSSRSTRQSTRQPAGGDQQPEAAGEDEDELGVALGLGGPGLRRGRWYFWRACLQPPNLAARVGGHEYGVGMGSPP